MDLIVEEGFDGLTMPKLAVRVGVAVGGLYRYFPSKTDLLVALQVRAVEQLGDWFEGASASPGREGVEQIVLSVESFSRNHRTSFALLELAVSDPRRLLSLTQVEEVERALQPVLARVGRRLEEAVVRGELRSGDTIQRTYVLWGLAFGCLHLRKRDGALPEPLHAAQLLQEGLRATLDGWGPARTS